MHRLSMAGLLAVLGMHCPRSHNSYRAEGCYRNKALGLRIRRLSTAGLLAVLGMLYPRSYMLFLGLMFLDIFSHWCVSARPAGHQHLHYSVPSILRNGCISGTASAMLPQNMLSGL